MLSYRLIALAILLFTSPSWLCLARSYKFNIKASPRQCKDLSVTIEGTDGMQPYHILAVPYIKTESQSLGSEASMIANKVFVGNSVSFQLAYPENQQFVVVVRRFLSLNVELGSLNDSLSITL